jgi:TetR/AcrR family transcriptional regulator, tetracycline repressor protein
VPPNQKRAPRDRLSREVVAARALELADADGLDALTIRRLAADLGVTPMALYWHFADKGALMAGVAEQLLGEVELPAAADGDPIDQLHELLSALLRTLRAHPRLARLVQTEFLSSDPGLLLTERALSLLHGAGFDPPRAAQLAVQALSTIVDLVLAEPGAELDVAADERDAKVREKRARLLTLPTDTYPALSASIDALTSCLDPGGYFEFGLDVFIAGCRELRRQQPAAVSW